MNRETILAMEPGVELDALVAEKIMGWKIEPGSAFYWTGPERCVRASFHKFSTDISAAWEVVKKMQDKRRFIHVETYLGSFAARVKIPGPKEIGYSMECDGAPEAICKAALVAVLEGRT